MTDKLSFTIDRTKWFRGRGGEDSALYVPAEQLSCCLGLMLQQRDFARDDMAGTGSPDYLPDVIRYKVANDDFGKLLVCGTWAQGTMLVDDAVSINDDPEINDTEREQKLTELFAKHNVELTFIN